MAILKGQLLAENADILSPTDDRIFKVLLIHPNAKQVLIDIISTVIQQKVTDVTIRNNELATDGTNDKNERFDVNCTIDNGDQVDVEMHCEKRVEIGNRFYSFINKYTYYLTDLHSSQDSLGIKYKNLVRTYQIIFSTYSVFPERCDFVSWFTLRTSDGHQLTDQINMIIIELDKLNNRLNKPVNELTSYEKWSLFLNFASDPVHRDRINDIIKEKEEIGMAATLLQEISKNEQERARYRSRKMYQTDMDSDRLTSEEIGEIRATEKWQVVVADKDEIIADKNAIIIGKNAIIADKDAEIADKDAEIANKDSVIASLRAQLENKK